MIDQRQGWVWSLKYRGIRVDEFLNGYTSAAQSEMMYNKKNGCSEFYYILLL